MGRSASRQVCDALASPGYPAALTGDRLAHMQNLAQRAASTFPPPSVHPTGLEEEPFVPTEEGNRAMAIGAAAVARAPKVPTVTVVRARFSPFPYSRQRTEEELGGIDVCSRCLLATIVACSKIRECEYFLTLAMMTAT